MNHCIVCAWGAQGPAENCAECRQKNGWSFASSLGTLFEWYDFYIYGALGVFLAKYGGAQRAEVPVPTKGEECPAPITGRSGV